MAGVFIPCPFKRGATGAEVLFHHRFRSREIFGVVKDFCPNFSKLSRKVFVQLLHIMKTFFGVTSKKGLQVIFCKPWAPFFKSSKVWRHFQADFQECCPGFQQIKTFGGALDTHLQQAPLFFITVS